MEIDKRAYSGAIYDVIKFDIGYDRDFVLPNNLMPLTFVDTFVFGRAFTARGDKTSRPDHKIVADMVDSMGDEDVYILQANDNSRAHFGDIMANFLDRNGVRGAVLQGWSRDHLAIAQMGFPVWCKGVQPQDSADRWGITTFGGEIVIGNIFITPDDYIFADMDGVLVIRHFLINEVLEKLPKKLDYEADIRLDIWYGQYTANEIYEKKGRW